MYIYFLHVKFVLHNWHHKNIERHTAHTIVSWPNTKQWIIVHTSDLMMIIRQSLSFLSIITREIGKLKPHSPTYFTSNESWRQGTVENLDAVTAVTDSFKMADTFTGDRTGGALAQTSTQTIGISVRQGRMWVYIRESMGQTDGLLWGLNRRLLIREMLQ